MVRSSKEFPLDPGLLRRLQEADVEEIQSVERRQRLLREIADRLPFLSTAQLEEINEHRMLDDGDDS